MKKFELYTDKKYSKILYSLSKRYIKQSCKISKIYNKNIRSTFEKKVYAKRVKNLNHNGKLLPKKELNDTYFKIFKIFKIILKRYIPNNCLIHFPIVIRLNNILSDSKSKYSSIHPHVDAWAGEPSKSRIISFNVFSSNNHPH